MYIYIYIYIYIYLVIIIKYMRMLTYFQYRNEINRLHFHLTMLVFRVENLNLIYKLISR